MKTLDKELYIQHAKRLQVILNDKSTFIPFLNRQDFKNTIETQLNVLYACEKRYSKEGINSNLTTKSLVKEFNKLTKSVFILNKSIKYDDDSDLIDTINYLVTFCRNMFKVDLDDLVSGKNITATDPKIDLRAKTENDNNTPKANRNFAFAGSGIPLATTPYENPYLVGKAYAKLNDDIKQGKFYRYKTKPSIIPIVKWISICLLFFMTTSLIISAVFAFMTHRLPVLIESETKHLECISSGIMYIVLGLFCVYPLYMELRTILGKNSINHNDKYHFSIGITLLVLALSLLIILLDINKTWLMYYNIQSTATDNQLFGWNSWKIMFIVDCSLLVANVIPIVLGSIFNPKLDPEIIERKIKEYIDLFSADTTSSSATSIGTNSQKETDKKNNDSKKKK